MIAYAWTAIGFSVLPRQHPKQLWKNGEFLPTTAVTNVDKVNCLLLSDRVLDGYEDTRIDVLIKPSRIRSDESRRLFLEFVTVFPTTRWIAKMLFGGTGKCRLGSGNRRLVHVFGLQRQSMSFPRTPFSDQRMKCISYFIIISGRKCNKAGALLVHTKCLMLPIVKNPFVVIVLKP